LILVLTLLPLMPPLLSQGVDSYHKTLSIADATQMIGDKLAQVPLDTRVPQKLLDKISHVAQAIRWSEVQDRSNFEGYFGTPQLSTDDGWRGYYAGLGLVLAAYDVHLKRTEVVRFTAGLVCSDEAATLMVGHKLGEVSTGNDYSSANWPWRLDGGALRLRSFVIGPVIGNGDFSVATYIRQWKKGVRAP
jgi:hypothetical protein